MKALHTRLGWTLPPQAAPHHRESLLALLRLGGLVWSHSFMDILLIPLGLQHSMPSHPLWRIFPSASLASNNLHGGHCPHVTQAVTPHTEQPFHLDAVVTPPGPCTDQPPAGRPFLPTWALPPIPPSAPCGYPSHPCWTPNPPLYHQGLPWPPEKTPSLLGST